MHPDTTLAIGLMTEPRLQTIETKLAYLEHTIEALNKVVYQQSQQLDALAEKNRHLNARVQGLLEQGSAQDIGASDEKPPHY